MNSIINLTRIQREITSKVLAVCADRGFVLAGGGALREHGLTARPTEDIDLFTNSLDVENFQLTSDAVVNQLRQNSWTETTRRSTDTFTKLLVEDENDLKTENDTELD